MQPSPPWPQCTVEAVAEFARQNGIYGSQNYLQWLAKEEALRSLLAQLINAPSKDDIALLKAPQKVSLLLPMAGLADRRQHRVDCPGIPIQPNCLGVSAEPWGGITSARFRR